MTRTGLVGPGGGDPLCESLVAFIAGLPPGRVFTVRALRREAGCDGGVLAADWATTLRAVREAARRGVVEFAGRDGARRGRPNTYRVTAARNAGPAPVPSARPGHREAEAVFP